MPTRQIAEVRQAIPLGGQSGWIRGARVHAIVHEVDLHVTGDLLALDLQWGLHRDRRAGRQILRLVELAQRANQLLIRLGDTDVLGHRLRRVGRHVVAQHLAGGQIVGAGMKRPIEVAHHIHLQRALERGSAEPLQNLMPNRALVGTGHGVAEHGRHVLSGEQLTHRPLAAHRLRDGVGHPVCNLLHRVDNLAQQRASLASIKATTGEVFNRLLQRHLLGV